jgi:nucleoside-diphosphate-sugar epimerase
MTHLLKVAAFSMLIGLSSSVMASVLVFGGSGRLGAEVVENLLAAGENVIVFVRPTSDRGRLDGMNIEYVIGDLLEAGSVKAAFEGRDIDAVINTVALRPGESVPYVIGEQNIDAATRGLRLSHMILFSATGAGDSKSAIPPQFYEEFKSTYLDRGTSEQIIKDGGTPYTFIRLGIVHDKPETGTGTMVEEPVLGPITRADAARLAVGCLRAARCMNKTFHATDGSLPLLP